MSWAVWNISLAKSGITGMSIASGTSVLARRPRAAARRRAQRAARVPPRPPVRPAAAPPSAAARFRTSGSRSRILPARPPETRLVPPSHYRSTAVSSCPHPCLREVSRLSGLRTPCFRLRRRDQGVAKRDGPAVPVRRRSRHEMAAVRASLLSEPGSAMHPWPRGRSPTRRAPHRPPPCLRSAAPASPAPT